MLRVLESLLERDIDITARAVARLHPVIESRFVDNAKRSRSTLVAQYRIARTNIDGGEVVSESELAIRMPQHWSTSKIELSKSKRLWRF